MNTSLPPPQPIDNPKTGVRPGLYSTTYQTAAPDPYPYPSKSWEVVPVAARLIVYPDVVRIRERFDRPRAQVGGGIRGAIVSFTRKSRGRLLLRMAQLHDADRGAFITLTYPGIYPDDPRQFKRDLKVLIQRMRRRWKDLRGIWRLEFQRRGAPHYHLLAFGLPNDLTIYLFRAWVADAWYQVVGSGDDRHLRAGVRVDRIENRAHAMRYASKYCAKDGYQDLEGDFGRRWGHFGPCDFSPISDEPISWGQWVILQRLAIRWLTSRTNARGEPLRSAHRLAVRFGGVGRNRSSTCFGLGLHSQAARSGAPPDGLSTIEKMKLSAGINDQHDTEFLPDLFARRLEHRIGRQLYYEARAIDYAERNKATYVASKGMDTR